MNAILARQFRPRSQAPTRLLVQPFRGALGAAEDEALVLGAAPMASFLKAQPYGVSPLRPQPGRLGASDPETGPNPKTVEEWVALVGPIAREVLASSATQDVEVLRAKIANQTRMMQVSPEPLKTLYRNNIAVLKAKLRAALQERELERESQQATRTWRIAGYAVTGTGMAVGAGVVVALLALASKWTNEGRAARRKS